MTAEDRRLVALAAALCPARAGALLGRLAAVGRRDLAALAATLAAAPRRARLAALACALPAGGPPPAADAHPVLARLARQADGAAGVAGVADVAGADGGAGAGEVASVAEVAGVAGVAGATGPRTAVRPAVAAAEGGARIQG